MTRRNSIAARLLPCVLAAVCAGAAGVHAQVGPAAPTAPAAKPPTGPGSLSGVWFNSDFVPANMFDPEVQVLLDSQGQRPPLQPWASALLDKRIRDAKAGRTFPTTLSQCRPMGIPAMMYYPANPLQILERPNQVTMLFEQLTLFRVIRLNATHPAHLQPSFLGDSIGHWEGDTLVVDTIDLTDKTSLDEPGMPHSTKLHLVERYRRISGNAIELVMNLDDPKTFTRPWTLTTHLKLEPPDRGVEEWYCENQRNPVGKDGSIGNIP